MTHWKHPTEPEPLSLWRTVHPEGWLSSACYIAVPDTPPDSQEAWIKFGEPGIPTLPPLPPEHLIKPEPGMLVLFPSYM